MHNELTRRGLPFAKETVSFSQRLHFILHLIVWVFHQTHLALMSLDFSLNPKQTAILAAIILGKLIKNNWKQRILHEERLKTSYQKKGTTQYMVKLVGANFLCVFSCCQTLFFIKYLLCHYLVFVKEFAVHQSKWITDWYMKLYRFNYWLRSVRDVRVIVANMSITCTLCTCFVHQRKTTQSVLFKETKSDST